ncbi:leucine-rich repeat flightless-interacting protein 2-like [Anomaloglossus baeobatrachus]|uniref:leucine-rich repeat flightless-interacting protein 2-like n=1 Tax=Anomaloglossus baeobatrachus TaxID=238106 RepID=UPI003F4F8E15
MDSSDRNRYEMLVTFCVYLNPSSFVMQCSDMKKNFHSPWSWRGMRDARRQILYPDAPLNKLRESLDEVEDKYRNSLSSLTQLNNEKRNLEYQVNNLKDVIEEMEEKLIQNQAENKINLKKLKVYQTKLEQCSKRINYRDELLQKHGIFPEDVFCSDIKQRITTGVITPASAIQLPGDRGKGNDTNPNYKLKHRIEVHESKMFFGFNNE